MKQHSQVTVYIWLPHGIFEHGHTAVDIYNQEGKNEYISVYPSPDEKGIFSVKPQLRTKKEPELGV